MIQFKLALPALAAEDIATRELQVQIGEGPITNHSPDIEDTELEDAGFEGNDGVTVRGQLIDIDEDGERSQPREFNYVLTLKPPMPDPVRVIVTGST